MVVFVRRDNNFLWGHSADSLWKIIHSELCEMGLFVKNSHPVCPFPCDLVFVCLPDCIYVGVSLYAGYCDTLYFCLSPKETLFSVEMQR